MIYSQSGGKLNAAGDKIFDQSNVGVDDAAPGTGHAFGTSLVAGYAHNGSYADLVVEVSGQRVTNRANAGTVYTLFGKSSSGWAEWLSQIWHQNSWGIAGGSKTGDTFSGNCHLT